MIIVPKNSSLVGKNGSERKPLNKVKKIKFIGLGVVIHPDVGHKILRHMVKELALYDLRFLSYGQKTDFLPIFFKLPKIAVFWP